MSYEDDKAWLMGLHRHAIRLKVIAGGCCAIFISSIAGAALLKEPSYTLCFSLTAAGAAGLAGFALKWATETKHQMQLVHETLISEAALADKLCELTPN